MKTIRIAIELNRGNLGKMYSKLPFTQIDIFHFTLPRDEINKADRIRFKDDDGQIKELKNRSRGV